MKLSHKVNFGHGPKAETISDSYQREIDATLRKAEKAWRKAQQLADRAERLAEKQPSPETRASRDEARRLVLARLAELNEIERLMRRPTYAARTVTHRTGREERLEVGTPRRAKRKSQPVHPVTTRRK